MSAFAWTLLRRRGLLQVGDEGFLQRLDIACPQQCGGGILGQHFARVHQRDTVAARPLVHEMGRDENGDPLLAGQIDQQFPKAVTGHRVDA